MKKIWVEASSPELSRRWQTRLEAIESIETLLSIELPWKDGRANLVLIPLECHQVLERISALKASNPEPRILLGIPTEATPVPHHIEERVDDLLALDLDPSAFAAQIETQLTLCEQSPGDQTRSRLRPGIRGMQDLLGTSAAMRNVRAWIRTAANSRAPALLTGESGCGKELAAWALHRRSPWKAGPFLAFNPASVSESLLEAELFGHAKGAFTGADRARPGVIESAEGGSLFLDEIGELPLALQVRLLRFLESGSYQRLGESLPRRSTCRLIFATNRDLETEVQGGRFRKDLLFRLDVLRIRLPPLREHLEDLPILSQYLLEQLAGLRGLPPPPLEPSHLEILSRHSWPGNVRELRNCLERALLFGQGTRLDEGVLRQTVAPRSEKPRTEASDSPALASPGSIPPAFVPGRTLKEALEGFEAEFLRQALEHHQGNISATARAIGMGRRTLHERMDRYGLRE